MSRNITLVLLTALLCAVNAIPTKRINPSKVPRARIELHLHLEGAIRVSTLWQLAQQKNITSILSEVKNYDEFKRFMKVDTQGPITEFFSKFKVIKSIIADDLEAIERVAYELCEDEAKQGVLYFEARYSPHYLISNDGIEKGITVDKVVEAVNNGLKRGQQEFKVKARSILGCMYFRPETCNEVVNLANRYRNDGVVGIDSNAGEPTDGVYPQQIVDAFQKAKTLNIRRTVHAGGTNHSSANVGFALRYMFAERIGDGYHVVENATLYENVKHSTHFEVCPYSSFITGGVTKDFNNGTHPIVKFAKDEVSFSISKDDPTVIQTTLDDEYQLLINLGLNEYHIFRANLDAARNSFLPRQEASQLVKDFIDIYLGHKKVLTDFEV